MFPITRRIAVRLLSALALLAPAVLAPAVAPPVGAATFEYHNPTAYRQGDTVVFQWGPTLPYNYDKFIVRWHVGNEPDMQQDVIGSRTEGRFVIFHADPNRSYTFIVEGADDGTFGTIARQGWSYPVTVPALPKSCP